MAVLEGDIAIAVPKWKIYLFQILKQKCPSQLTGAQLPGGQQLPGAGCVYQLAVDAAA
jgi:hypothetical protein